MSKAEFIPWFIIFLFIGAYALAAIVAIRRAYNRRSRTKTYPAWDRRRYR